MDESPVREDAKRDGIIVLRTDRIEDPVLVGLPLTFKEIA